MKHDDRCELRNVVQTPWGMKAASCQCGSRAYPLCDGCREGRHLKHRAADRDCQCPLCEDVAA